MESQCPSFRAEAIGVELAQARLSPHLAVCADCVRWLDGLQRRESALAALPRLSAPFELEGGVVQALEAGFRQDRAVRALRGLERRGSPPELDRALDAELDAELAREWSPEGEAPESLPASLPRARRLGAPAKLADLVAEELGDPAGHRVRRYVGSLSRLSAPAELAERLALQGWSAARPGRGRPLALSGLALILVGLAATFVLQRAEPPRARHYDFVVEVVDSPAQLSGLAAGFLDGASGGRLSARSL